MVSNLLQSVVSYVFCAVNAQEAVRGCRSQRGCGTYAMVHCRPCCIPDGAVDGLQHNCPADDEQQVCGVALQHQVVCLGQRAGGGSAVCSCCQWCRDSHSACGGASAGQGLHGVNVGDNNETRRCAGKRGAVLCGWKMLHSVRVPTAGKAETATSPKMATVGCQWTFVQLRYISKTCKPCTYCHHSYPPQLTLTALLRTRVSSLQVACPATPA